MEAPNDAPLPRTEDQVYHVSIDVYRRSWTAILFCRGGPTSPILTNRFDPVRVAVRTMAEEVLDHLRTEYPNVEIVMTENTITGGEFARVMFMVWARN